MEGVFGRALDAREFPLQAAARDEYRQLPLTVECWARLKSKQRFNILVANEPKSSGTHWEVYTYATSGFFSVYMPGYAPAEVVSRVDVTDGKWHYLTAVMDGARTRLYVDGEKAAEVAVRRLPGRASVAGPMGIGILSERQLDCDGYVDEVRISAVAREITAMPTEPLVADADTIGLWHLDSALEGNAFKDSSPPGNPATDIYAGAPFRKPRYMPGSLAAMPPELDPVATHAALVRSLEHLKLSSIPSAAAFREGLLRDWQEQHFQLDRQLRGLEPLPKGAADQVLDRHALIHDTDDDPLGVVLRRTEALLDHLAGMPEAPDLSAQRDDLVVMVSAGLRTPVSDAPARKGYFLAACALRRAIALANPLMDFDEVLFVARGNYGGSRKTGPRVTRDDMGQHFATQYYGFNSIPGGGLFIARGLKGTPIIRSVTAQSKVTDGRLQGQGLKGGAYLAPDLSYDAKTIAFSWTENREYQWEWSNKTSWNLFRVNVDGSDLRQLTDSPWDDFDACWLPNGRIGFISERRGGYIRCFAGLDVPSHVLHSMQPDGSDIHPISYFETTEWHPSVTNDGMLAYTRWDYVDRENCLGSNMWTCHLDGRNPRAPHGNYPYPWHTFEDNTDGDGRLGRPYTEMNIRAIPGSHKYILTAAPHHGESFGSLVLLDPYLADDGHMSQLRRITPYAPFPETEYPGRSQYPYGTPWPLSEDFYLCNRWENLYLLDRFGNRVLLCENALALGQTDYNMRLIDPIPLRPRRVPITPPILTNQGENAGPNAPGATVGVMNVYNSDLPFPPGVKIKWLRILQNILKPNAQMGQPMIGYQNESTPRIPLGVVPVEEDGSAYFKAPVEKELIFQALDENYMAVQSMRSVAFVHPGENLSCLGCHERTHTAPPVRGRPLAAQRAPSTPRPEVGPVEPITYYRLVKPVFERTCLPCHHRTNKGLQDMSYGALEPYAFYFAGGMSGTTVKPIHGGSRTIPGRFGARSCPMGKALLDDTHRDKIPADDYRRVVLWLDANSLRLGAFRGEDRQIRGEVVWPSLDVDPADPQGLDKPR